MNLIFVEKFQITFIYIEQMYIRGICIYRTQQMMNFKIKGRSKSWRIQYELFSGGTFLRQAARVRVDAAALHIGGVCGD